MLGGRRQASPAPSASGACGIRLRDAALAAVVQHPAAEPVRSSACRDAKRSWLELPMIMCSLRVCAGCGASLIASLQSANSLSFRFNLQSTETKLWLAWFWPLEGSKACNRPGLCQTAASSIVVEAFRIH